ncbi:hypothetical protein [Cupriavidus sp. L7L]|uniref:hypothetical protein n=1 Tax=Cupriavidus sp. L7L TaxID=2546443 RepID=UPI0010551067|nr:hypothetical protein [Cupriavidus sp. L7L]TDF62197.1 hypothetical protein E1J61_30525 [Cupriavidus sp. L7L]
MNPIIETGTGRHGGNHRNAPRKYTKRRTNSRIEAARQRGNKTSQNILNVGFHSDRGHGHDRAT